jgi:hypothetical protein
MTSVTSADFVVMGYRYINYILIVFFRIDFHKIGWIPSPLLNGFYYCHVYPCTVIFCVRLLKTFLKLWFYFIKVLWQVPSSLIIPLYRWRLIILQVLTILIKVMRQVLLHWLYLSTAVERVVVTIQYVWDSILEEQLQPGGGLVIFCTTYSRIR